MLCRRAVKAKPLLKPKRTRVDTAVARVLKKTLIYNKKCKLMNGSVARFSTKDF